MQLQLGSLDSVHNYVIFRSTLRQSRPNKAGLKCPSVRPSVHKKDSSI